MKKVFEKPFISITKFSVENIVTASGETPSGTANLGTVVVSAADLVGSGAETQIFE